VNIVDEETARLIRPKLKALKTFMWNVSVIGPGLPDNETRSTYRAMYDDIRDSLGDPKLEIFAPPLPRLGTTGDRAKLRGEHQTRILQSGGLLEAYLGSLLSQVGPTQQAVEKPLQCFLAYRFTDQSERYATEVREFLELLDIDVISGGRFEPRSVSEKIKELLSEDLDFGVLIVSDEGESMWTRDEVNSLWSQGKKVIVLVEEGTQFTQGLQGDLEWIPFPQGHISDAFSRLVEGTKFIQSTRQ